MKNVKRIFELILFICIMLSASVSEVSAMSGYTGENYLESGTYDYEDIGNSYAIEYIGSGELVDMYLEDNTIASLYVRTSSSKGIVTLLKPGTTKITAKVNIDGKIHEYSGTITVKPKKKVRILVPETKKKEKVTLSKIKNVNIKQKTKSFKGWVGENKLGKKKYKCVQVSWEKMKNVTGYEIYRYGNASKEWVKIKTIKKASTTKYVLPEVYKGKKIKIKIRAYKNTSSGKVYGKYSNVKVYKPKRTCYQALWGEVKTDKNHNVIQKTYRFRFAGEEAFILQNKLRKKAGRKPLKWNKVCFKMSELRAKETSVRWSHNRPDGTAWVYAFDTCFGDGSLLEFGDLAPGNINENIGQGPGVVLHESMVEGWKESGPHYYYMTDKSVVTGSISAYYDEDTESTYWVATFMDRELK